MRTATIVSLICVAGALSGCGGVLRTWQIVEFVASNPDSVLLDFRGEAAGRTGLRRTKPRPSNARSSAAERRFWKV